MNVAKARKTKTADDAAPADRPAKTITAAQKLAISSRLSRLGVWPKVSILRDEMFREARANGMDKEQATSWVYGELDRLYPEAPGEAEAKPGENPVKPVEDVASEGEGGVVNPANRGEVQVAGGARPMSAAEAVVIHAREAAARGKVAGLDAIPAAWPMLPAAAPLATELGWVQSNRLAIVSEPPNGAVKVDLSRAAEPAPSRSALAWLETAIRNYAKYTDVLARIAAGTTDEADDVRRERSSIAEIERLLSQMRGAI